MNTGGPGPRPGAGEPDDPFDLLAGDRLEERLREALRSGPHVAIDLGRVIETGRARGARLRRRRQLLVALAAAASVVGVAGVSVLATGLASWPGGHRSGAVAGGQTASSGTSGTSGSSGPSGSSAATGTAAGTAGPTPSSATAPPDLTPVPGRPPLVAGQTLVAPPDGRMPRSLALSGDGRLLAVSEESGSVRLIDVSGPGTGRLVATVPTGSDWVASVALNADGTVLAATGSTGQAWTWDLSDPVAPRRVTTLPVTSMYTPDLTFSPDGRRLAVGQYDNTVRLYAVGADAAATPAGVLRDPATSDVMSLTFSPDGRTLAAASYHRVTLWDLSGPVPRVAGGVTQNSQGVTDVGFSRDGRYLLAADGDVAVWDLAHPGHPVRVARLAGAGATLAVDPTAARAASLRRTLDRHGQPVTTLVLWDLADPAAPARSRVLPASYGGDDRPLAWSPDGARVYELTDGSAVVATATG